MPKLDQQNIRIFHVLEQNNDKELLEFLKKNLPLFKGYLLVFDTLSDEIKEFLDSADIDYIKNKNLKFIENKNDIASILKQANKEVKTINIKKPESKKDLQTKKTKFITRLIRSGEYIVNSGDIFVFNRVNSGAEIESENNICIFGECNGNIKCEGEFLVLSKITNGKVTLQGDIITPNMLKYSLNLIYKIDNELIIKDVLSLS